MAGIMEADMTGKNQKPVEYKGVIYPSITALAEAYGLRRDTLNLRLKKHIPLEMSRYAKGVITYHGIDYPSMTALAEHFDLKLSTCHMRLKRGVPLTRPVHKGAMKPLEYEGVRYESVRDFAERNGVRYEDASACIDGIKGRWLDEKE